MSSTFTSLGYCVVFFTFSKLDKESNKHVGYSFDRGFLRFVTSPLLFDIYSSGQLCISASVLIQAHTAGHKSLPEAVHKEIDSAKDNNT